ncbi:hypothetical protein DYB26_006271 [Aphanomyces astaci]|uniref:Uncharacterized protein n=1 Tax=Aphanomyces astaci TaxID=112090 RepID=A0A397CPN5_APHAT|nr:hypothetical protein DYB38_008019 [Aphanomyces astaci]RHZ13066.1 hypothetical protein DYB26_006271 [Aphanomyces astaci]
MPTQPSNFEPLAAPTAEPTDQPTNSPPTAAVEGVETATSPPTPAGGGRKPKGTNKHPTTTTAPPPGPTLRGHPPTPLASANSTRAQSHDKAAVDEAWRKAWYAQHPRTDRCRPTEDEFKRAVAKFKDDTLSGNDHRFAALASLPTPVEPSSSFSMMILCRSGAATFPLQVMLDSIGSEVQPREWLAAKSSCRDFKKVNNVGISFTCTDRTTVDKIGGLKLTVCGKLFPILAYSEYSALYWVDIVLSNEATAGSVYDYFVEQNERPVLIRSTYNKFSVQSRHITVYFQSRDPPECLMFGKDDPVREIYPLGSGSHACYVNHRISRYNAGPPPSIKTKQARDRTKHGAKHQPPTPITPSDVSLDTPPIETNTTQGPPFGPQPPEPADFRHDHEMEDSDSSEGENEVVSFEDDPMDIPPVRISPSIAGDRSEVVRPSAPMPDAPLWHRIQFSRKAIGVNATQVSPKSAKAIMAKITSTSSTIEYSFSTLNRFEVLADDDTSGIPPPLQVSMNGSQNIRAKFDRPLIVSRAPLRQHDTLASDYDVESMPMEEFLSFLESYIVQYQGADDPEEVMAMMQANPGHLLPLIDGNHPTNYDILSSKLPTHLMQRCIQPRFTLEEVQAARDARNDSIFTTKPIWQFLVPGTSTDDMLPYINRVLAEPIRPLARAIARLCQYLQINQPELYFNQAKIFGLLSSLRPTLPAATMPANPHFLWTDATICALAKSELGAFLLRCHIPGCLHDAIRLAAAAYPLSTQHLGCFLA